MTDSANIAAVILAAGLSTRMGRPKMVLPWGDTSVIGNVISTLIGAGIEDMFVITGGAHLQIMNVLENFPVRTIFNPEFANGEMIYSLQLGLRNMPINIQASLVVLGDQPQIEVKVVRQVIEIYHREKAKLIVPSYKMKRGHPWLIDRKLWEHVLDIEPPQTLRDFMQQHNEIIRYAVVETPSIVEDLDTPEDYARYQSGFSE